MRALFHLADYSQHDTLALAFRADGWLVDHSDAVDDLADWCGPSNVFDVIVTSSPAALRKLRLSGDTTPAVILADLDLQQRIHALTVGADDVLATATNPTELAVRCAAIARRARGFGCSVIAAGPVTIDLHSKQVYAAGNAVHLTGKEYTILETLIVRGRTQTKDDLMSAMYTPGADDEPEVKIVDVFVCKLRKKLRLAGVQNVIETCWGRGYRFSGADAGRAAA